MKYEEAVVLLWLCAMGGQPLFYVRRRKSMTLMMWMPS